MTPLGHFFNNRDGHPTELLDSINTTRKNPLLDENAKSILSYRIMQAMLLKHCVPEFEETSLEWICRNAFIGEDPLESASFGQVCFTKLSGDSGEFFSPGNKSRNFDTVYRAKTEAGETLVIDVEYQGDFYSVDTNRRVNRAQYQSSLLLTRQNGTLFHGQEFENICKSYTLWIYMAPKGKLKNGMNLTQFDTWRIHGRVEEQEFGLNNIISIYLDDPSRVENHDIIYFLSVLLRSNQVEAVLKMLEEFEIPIDEVDREELSTMCDISVGMYNIGEEAGMEKGLAKGMEKGMEKGMVKGKQDEQRHTIQILLDLGQSVEQIIHEFHYPETLVHEVVKEQLA